MLIEFTKMHGLGNDFMVIDLVTQRLEITKDLVQLLGDRHLGIGFDQLLVVEPPMRPDVDFSYRIFNTDGTEVEQCGNGARCFARFVFDQGLFVWSKEDLARKLEALGDFLEKILSAPKDSFAFLRHFPLLE